MQPTPDYIKPPVLLVVDDDPDLRSSLKTKLQHAGFVIHTAQDGEEGLTAALKELPDLILLDIIMPKMDGVEMLRRLREDPWGKEARVIMLTNLTDDEKEKESKTLGAEDVMLKTNVKLEEIVEKVRSILS